MCFRNQKRLYFVHAPRPSLLHRVRSEAMYLRVIGGDPLKRNDCTRPDRRPRVCRKLWKKNSCLKVYLFLKPNSYYFGFFFCFIVFHRVHLNSCASKFQILKIYQRTQSLTLNKIGLWYSFRSFGYNIITRCVL